MAFLTTLAFIGGLISALISFVFIIVLVAFFITAVFVANDEIKNNRRA